MFMFMSVYSALEFEDILFDTAFQEIFKQINTMLSKLGHFFTTSGNFKKSHLKIK